MNVNDVNAVRAVLQEALGGKEVVLENPLASAEDLLAVAEELKAEDPRLFEVRVRKAGPTRIALKIETFGR
jgi:hypothetical protein